MKENKEKKKSLVNWQTKLSRAEVAYSDEIGNMDERHRWYRGEHSLPKWDESDKNEKPKRAKNVQNMILELIETEVSSAIPKPKVTALRQEDAPLAKLIEDMLRNKIELLPSEEINDAAERIGYIQGGVAFHAEWDSAKKSPFGMGDVVLSVIHPKQLIPQPGVTDIDDMDYFFLKLSVSKTALSRRFDIDLSKVSEEEPEVRGEDSEVSKETDVVTEYIAYYKNGNGGIGKFSWISDIVLEDYDDYQARRNLRCKKCGAPRTINTEPVAPLSPVAERMDLGADEPFGIPEKLTEDRCAFCGNNDWSYEASDYEEIYSPIHAGGIQLSGMVEREVEGVTILEPTRIRSYKPDCFPVILQKNIPEFGRFLGISDVDIVKDSQIALNRLNSSMLEKSIEAVTVVTLPPNTRIEAKPGVKYVHLARQEDKNYFGVYPLQGDISQEMAAISTVYQQGRYTLGITDAYQGRPDTTAKSGKAKQISASQSASRLESKRVAKDTAYAKLYEILFKYYLAYSDEPFPVASRNIYGDVEYTEFSRWAFLRQDETGEYYWNDDFVFSIDSTEPLASNREAMWQETRQNLQSGAYGNPQELGTLIMFWSKMEALMYPGAAETLRYLKEKKETQEEQARIAYAKTGGAAVRNPTSDVSGAAQMMQSVSGM